MPSYDELAKAKEEAVQNHYLRPKEYTTLPGLARNVIGVGIGPKFRRNQAPGDLCVHYYVEKKIEPKEAIPDRFKIQELLGNVQTDVIETRRFVSFQAVAAPGSSIGLDYMAPNVDSTITSTLSAFVKIKDAYYALGSNHGMTVNGRVPVGTRVMFKPPNQFIDDASQFIFAHTAVHVPLSHEYLNNVDCALAEVEREYWDRIETEFPKRIVKLADPIDPAPGMKVARVDDDDHPTGTITGVNVRMRIDFRFGTFEFDDLVLIEGSDGRFADPGDSGALLVDQATNRATALVIGGSSKYTIACPLAAAFAELTQALAKQNGGQKQLLSAMRPMRIELLVDSLRAPAPKDPLPLSSESSMPTSAGGGGD